MAAILIVAILVMTAAVAALAIIGPRPLLRWYLREVRPLKIAERPDEAIVTYPLA